MTDWFDALSPDQQASLRVSFLASNLLEALARLALDDRDGLLHADLKRVTAGFTDEERNSLAMATAAVAAHLRVNPRAHDDADDET